MFALLKIQRNRLSLNAPRLRLVNAAQLKLPATINPINTVTNHAHWLFVNDVDGIRLSEAFKPVT